MPKDKLPIDDAEIVAHLLQAGDKLACCEGSWRLVAGNIAVTDDAIRALKAGSAAGRDLGGRLVSMGDQLPFAPRQMAQTWRWARSRKKLPA